MAEQPTLLQRIGASPGKLIVVALLAVILVVVLVWQFGGGGSESTQQAKPADKATVEQPATSKSSNPITTAIESSTLSAANWPTVSLDEALGHDPFALPAVLRRGTPESGTNPSANSEADEDEPPPLQLSETFTKLQSEGVGIILQSNGRRIAAIGSRAVHVGEVVEGMRVVDIRPDGTIVFVPAGREDRQ